MDNNCLKDDRLQIRVSLTDKQRMEQAAKRRGLGLSAFVREAAARAAGIAA